MMETIKRIVVEYYESCLQKNTDMAHKVGWKDKKSQYLRFKILSEVNDLNGKSILDVGCGLGEFYNYLRINNINAIYHGVDLSSVFIEKAKTLYPEASFEQADILKKNFNKRFDYVISSGIFNVKRNLNESYFSKYVKRMIIRMYELSTCGVAFNLMTSYVDFKNENLYYSDPCKMFKFCKKLSKYVVLRHDYPLFEYTIYIYRKGENN